MQHVCWLDVSRNLFLANNKYKKKTPTEYKHCARMYLQVSV